MARFPKVTAVVKRSDILERRLANPFGGGSLEIPSKLKDRQNRPVLTFRIVNGEIAPDHTWRTVSMKGWDFATPEDIDGRPEDYGFEVRQGRLVRGIRGQEVLMKMDRSDYEAIQLAKATKNTAALQGRATKRAIVDAASAELGDQGAAFLQRQIQDVEIRDTHERIPVEDR